MDKLFLHTADCSAATPLEKIAGLSEGLKIKGALSKEAKAIHSKDFVLLCAHSDVKTFRHSCFRFCFYFSPFMGRGATVC